MKLRDILKESEDRGLTSEVKKHFLEIVSTYNKYHESMDRKSDIIEVAETLYTESIIVLVSCDSLSFYT